MSQGGALKLRDKILKASVGIALCIVGSIGAAQITYADGECYCLSDDQCEEVTQWLAQDPYGDNICENFTEHHCDVFKSEYESDIYNFEVEHGSGADPCVQTHERFCEFVVNQMDQRDHRARMNLPQADSQCTGDIPNFDDGEP